jgi:hypothetical protein
MVMKNKGPRIVDARADDKGNIVAVKFQGNTNFTAVERAIPIVARGSANAHVVRKSGAKPHLRTNPDGREANNLDEMARNK